MKKTKKPAPAKWGTMEWIKANPWMSMDRKRRKRAERVLGEKLVKRLKDRVHTCCLAHALEGLMIAYDLDFKRSDLKRVESALVLLSKFENAVYNEVFGIELAKAWGLVGKKAE